VCLGVTLPGRCSPPPSARVSSGIEFGAYEKQTGTRRKAAPRKRAVSRELPQRRRLLGVGADGKDAYGVPDRIVILYRH
jgi:hypothetical protein